MSLRAASGSCERMASSISSCAFWVAFAERTSRMSWSVCTSRSRYAATVAASSSLFAASATATWKSMLASVCGACSRTTERPFSTDCSMRLMAAASARSAANSDVAVSTTVRASARPESVMRRRRIVLEIHDVVVAELFEQAVLRREEEERLVAVVRMLVHGVLRDIKKVAGHKVPARWFLGDARVVLLSDLGFHVPVQAVALACHHID